ncbi:helix-turn-helix domain-containing protein [Pontibacter locisalis]|uniref:Helix-turn-helix domain-containing protein n=1 Tax=Pontibacter locisalis TaxID=1719035 RepID=A0ABW5IT52_9BACT
MIKDHHFKEFTIQNVDLFNALNQIPNIVLSPRIIERVQSIVEMIDEFSGSAIPNKESAIISLIKTLLVYCDSKCNLKLHLDGSNTLVNIVSRFKDHVSRQYTKEHKVSYYAALLNISPKYLNEAVKTILGVTAKSIIQEQLIIQARKELKFSHKTIKEISYELGFPEPFHFSSFFKTQIGISPSDYRLQ